MSDYIDKQRAAHPVKWWLRVQGVRIESVYRYRIWPLLPHVMLMRSKLKRALYKNRDQYASVWFSYSVMGGCGNDSLDEACHVSMDVFDEQMRFITEAIGAFETSHTWPERVPSLDEIKSKMDKRERLHTKIELMP